jgi:energy-coupling factor transport system ATP-binding protein
VKEPFIRFENVSYSYEGDDDGILLPPVLKNVSLEIEKGSFVAVLGHNGSGKSTLAKLVNMILYPTEGKIYIDGRDITDESMTEDDVYDVRRRVGMVFQNPDNQLVATVVEEDVAFGPENLGIDPIEIRRRVDEALETVGMSDYKRHSPHQLSGGQKQRIAIAGIIAMLPECIVFDEATAMLDPRGRADVMDTIERLNREQGITVLHITHNMDEAIRADRVIVVSDGCVVIDGTPEQVFSNVEQLRLVGLDVPQVTELMYELKSLGFDVDHSVLDEEKCADALAALINGRN